ncbi:hypothetical protein GW17_00008508 [Ensete ventricosum]|nr:hypothetical protein GW17_00008508 [Ensete ventricosum]RZR96434.1 hypothetical protein BHM03_00025451 [Ensete ventricosum]
MRIKRHHPPHEEHSDAVPTPCPLPNCNPLAYEYDGAEPYQPQLVSSGTREHRTHRLLRTTRDRGARFLCHRPLTFPFPPRGFRFVLLLWLRNERKPIIDAMNAKQTVELESRVIFDLGTVPVV